MAIGVAWADPSPGNGVRPETLLEIYYRIEIVKTVSLTPDLQMVFNPSNDTNSDLAVVPGFRFLMQF